MLVTGALIFVSNLATFCTPCMLSMHCVKTRSTGQQEARLLHRSVVFSRHEDFQDMKMRCSAFDQSSCTYTTGADSKSWRVARLLIVTTSGVVGHAVVRLFLQSHHFQQTCSCMSANLHDSSSCSKSPIVRVHSESRGLLQMMGVSGGLHFVTWSPRHE